MTDASTLPRVRVDWTIPAVPLLVFIIGLVGQSIAIGVVYGSMNTRMTAVEEQMRDNKAAPETVARLDERTKAMQEQLTDIKSQLSAAHK